MSDQVALQADVGALSLAGLGAFSQVLAILSTDNVTPMAMLQMEQLGSLFHVNGKFAAEVPEAMRRSSSRPVGRLALAVGWRRGDSVSVMAQSAGGQAAALLSFCLINMYPQREAGTILSRLCHSQLPKSLPVASVAHLTDVAALLASKLNKLGFGNLLAEQALRILTVYEKLETTPPPDLMEVPVAESIAELLERLASLREEDSIVRITGSHGMLYFLGVILFMFPIDAVVTVESFIISEGPGRRIMVEICNEQPTTIQLEKQLAQPPLFKLPIAKATVALRIYPCCSFEWKGWLAHKLQLEFASFGLHCSCSSRDAG
ncbi:hypothetical protein GQ53DRAFT_802408 [Thozetella sp. PMI_491]|nr:hypothetical protein GQ53DRAFT_802408 [Thozetella sp. PMI_491]